MIADTKNMIYHKKLNHKLETTSVVNLQEVHSNNLTLYNHEIFMIANKIIKNKTLLLLYNIFYEFWLYESSSHN